jgi:hypothetical protein
VLCTCYAPAACDLHANERTVYLEQRCYGLNAQRGRHVAVTAVGPLCLPRAHSISFVPHLSWLVCAVPTLCTALRFRGHHVRTVYANQHTFASQWYGDA